MKLIRITTILFFCVLLTQYVSAAGNSQYLPLKTDALIELELEKLSTVAKMPVLSKPFHIATINLYLEKIKDSHPRLFGRVKSYISRYRGDVGLTSLVAKISYSNLNNKFIPNSRGITSESNIQVEAAGYWDISNGFAVNLGGILYDGDDVFIPTNSYLSFTHDYFQIDVGYKEMWTSPFQESSMLLSTNAKPIARFSVSSPKPISDWNFRYDFSYGEVTRMDQIRFADDYTSGNPGFLTMHTSFQPFEWWTLGASRTLMFGGGERKITLGDIWKAIIDPVAGDNCGGVSDLQDCKDEAGNQQASILNKFDLNWKIPFSLYVEVAAEDTNNFKNYRLGNKTYNVGLFFPYLSDQSSLLFEVQHIQNAWYTHGIYQDGYTNDGSVMGHWWGNEKLPKDGIGAQILTMRYNREINENYHLDAKFATLSNKNLSDEGNYDEGIYVRGYELTIGLENIRNKNIWRYELYLGKTVLNDNFARASISYRWK